MSDIRVESVSSPLLLENISPLTLLKKKISKMPGSVQRGGRARAGVGAEAGAGVGAEARGGAALRLDLRDADVPQVGYARFN